MNKSIYIFLLFAASIFFISCDSEAPRVSVTGISLNETQLTMTVGDPVVALIATVHPNDATNPRVRWESDDTDVAIVSFNGAVIALSAGTATITATTADGNFSATCEVTVTSAPILVTGVTLENCNAATPLAVGNTRQLSATVAPADATNRAVAWASSDNDIAAVSDNGIVTAVAEGTVTITVTTECGSHTATCEITVIPPIPVTGITITGRNPIQLVIDATDRFSFSIIPNYATNQAVTWSSNDPTIATVDAVNGTITAFSEGSTVITATTQCGLHTATGLVVVTGEINISTSSDGVVINGVRWATVATASHFQWNDGDFTGTEWYEKNDPCPEGWQVPTPGQLRSLNNVSRGWITLNGVNGRIFGTEVHIFLPVTGWIHHTTGAFVQTDTHGLYWSRERCTCCELLVTSLQFYNSNSKVVTSSFWDSSFRDGLSVRCVAK